MAAKAALTTGLSPLDRLRARVRRRFRPRVPQVPIRLDRIAIPSDPQEAERRFLPAGYSRNPPVYFEDQPEPGREYQPGVYSRAARLARRLGAKRIVDVGCGQARKLAPLRDEFDLIGIDTGANIEFCRAEYGFGTWIDHDLESGERLPLEEDLIAGSVLVCADVIEHMGKPERAVRALAAGFPPARAVLISTPDRHRSDPGRDQGPPSNRHHVCEWRREEFAKLLRWSGFAAGRILFTRSWTGAFDLATLLFVARDAEPGR